VEAKVEDLLTTVDENTLVILPPCDVSKEIHSLKVGKACGFDDISNECPRHLQRISLVHLAHILYNMRSNLSLPNNLEGSKIQTSAETLHGPKI
jgi:hypothetical protein